MVKLKISSIFLLLGTFFISSCSSWIYGESNMPEPAKLEAIEAKVSTTLLWRQDLGKGGKELGRRLLPDSDGQNVYAVSADGRFYSFDVQSGRENYRINLKNDISAGVVLYGNYVFLGTASGELMALNKADGSELWRVRLSTALQSLPAVSDGMVVVYTPDGQLSSYSVQNGDLNWRYHMNVGLMMMRGTASPVVGNGLVMMPGQNGEFLVMDLFSGIPIANERFIETQGSTIVSEIADQDATPKINGAVLFSSAYQNLVFALDLNAGVVIWENEGLSTLRDFALSPNALFLVTPLDSVYALSQDNGRVLWQDDSLKGRRLSPPLAIPGLVAVIDFEGYLTWFDIQTGEALGRYKLGSSGSKTEALVLEDRIIWQLENGQLLAFRPE